MLGGMLGRHDQGGGNIITKHYANGEYTQQDDGSYVRQSILNKSILYSFME